MDLWLLVDPRIRGATFAERLDVARAELASWRPEAFVAAHAVGDLEFLQVHLDEADLTEAARRSFVHGMFLVEGSGLRPLDASPDWALPEALVVADRYRGKTHERVTQLSINLAMDAARLPESPATLLDPVAGRATTLLWAARYGLASRGIEREARHLDGLHRHIKRQAKVHRIRHRHQSGFMQKKNRDGVGRFVHYDLGGHELRLIAGDTADAPRLLQGQRFDLIVADLPYGVQFRGGRHRLADQVAAWLPAWTQCARPGAGMALIYNTYQPTPEQLADAVRACGWHVASVSVAHRMSESILRDVLVAVRPPA